MWGHFPSPYSLGFNFLQTCTYFFCRKYCVVEFEALLWLYFAFIVLFVQRFHAVEVLCM